MKTQRHIIDVTQRRVVVDLPASFANRRVQLIAHTVDDEPEARLDRPLRQPSPLIAGKGRTIGDIIGPLLDVPDKTDAP